MKQGIYEGLCAGLSVWGEQVRASLSQLSDDQIIAELEGCNDIRPTVFMQNVSFKYPNEACEAFFEEVVKSPDVDKNVLLAFCTGLPKLFGDGTIRPTSDGKTKIEIWFDPARPLKVDKSGEHWNIEVHTCFYQVFMPVFHSAQDLKAALLQCYRTRNYNLQ